MSTHGEKVGTTLNGKNISVLEGSYYNENCYYIYVDEEEYAMRIDEKASDDLVKYLKCCVIE